jgi:rhamnogalacturonan endolyase
VVIEEGELGQCDVNGVVESTNAGFTGTGYLNSDNAVGASIEWALNVGEAGTYSLEFAYANQGAERSADILVNGTATATGLSFPSTSSWSTWSTATVDVMLSAGENRIVLRAAGADGLANIDKLRVTGTAVSASDCDGNVGTGGSGSGGTGSGGGTGTCGGAADGHYQMEDLDRGVVAVRGNDGNYVGWRMMGYEYNRSDPSSVSYKLYRDGTFVATVTDSTNYWDSGAPAGASYSVSVVVNGNECPQSNAVKPWAQNYLRVPLSPPSGYSANDASPADLDGDGQYELVLKWYPNNAKDNAQDGVTDSTILEGLKLDGTSLWRIDLGRNIRSGAHYTQMSVYDFDGDGRAEVSVKTAPNTRDGTGAYLSNGPAASDDDSADYRNGSGYVLSGPEYLTVFDGLTGKELATVNYPVPRGNVSSWGDNYGNRVDRFNGGVAMVTDAGTNAGRPSIVQQRGYYTRLTVSAFHWRDQKLTQNWVFDSAKPGNGAAAGQGDHSSMTADMDGDGGQEINTGALTIGSDGTFRCATGNGHGDAQHVGELVPGKGITVFTVYEGSGGFSVHNGNTCEIYARELGGGDNGRGAADDVDPGNPGAEFWSATKANLRSCADGSNVGAKPQSQNFLIYWDADESRELQDGVWIGKYEGGTLLNASGCSGNNGTKNTPTLTADLLGDWREELVVRESNNSALRVYTTTDVTERRIYTLMHDPTYRMQVTWEQSSYNQPPHTGFHIGSGMADPPEPDIHVR